MIPAPEPPRPRLHRVEDLVLAAALAALVLLAVVQIGLRVLFDSGVLWLDPLLRIGVLWIAMLGAMVAARESRHIGLDLASHALPPPLLRATRLLAFGFAAAVAGVLAWQSLRMVMDEYALGAVAVGVLPVWLAQAILPLAFAVMSIRLLLTGIRPPPPALPSMPMGLPEDAGVGPARAP
jgi:TRAP-type C4-dicarboxylate transport system permease small subunit